MSATRGAFVWSELLTSNPGAAARFYRAVFGWHMRELPWKQGSYTSLRAGGVRIGGMMPSPAGGASCWAPGIGVLGADEGARRLAQAGGRVITSGRDVPDLGHVVRVADPQGALFTLVGSPTTAQPSAGAAPGCAGWLELHSRDWMPAWDFYRGLFGWEQGASTHLGPLGTYQTFCIDGVPAGGMFASPIARKGPFWLTYFNVPDIDAAFRAVTDNGGGIAMGPQAIPDGRFIVQALDPQGAVFGLLGPRS